VRVGRIKYSDAEMAWLEANRAMIISDYHYAFRLEFSSRTDVTAPHLHGLRKRKGWKIGSQKGRTAGRSVAFSPLQLEWLQTNCTMALPSYHLAFCASFNRADISAENLHGLRKRKGWKTGRTGQFAKGATPWSKGKKIGNNPGSALTQFKPGQQPANAKPFGYEHVRTDGYVAVAVDQENPYTGAERRMAIKHRYLWEQQHGPVPEGMVLKCKDGNRLNADPANWEPVPIGLLPRLNGKSGRNYDHAPDELKPTIMAVAKLEHRAREKRHGKAVKHDDRKSDVHL